MADTSVRRQSPGAPELVEILKRLELHRRKVRDRIFGKEFLDNLNKIEERFEEALRADDYNTAEDLLCRFVDAANVECSEESRQQMLINLDNVMNARRGTRFR